MGTGAEFVPGASGEARSEPGWYPSPDDPTGRWLRRWSGQAWSDDLKPATRTERENLDWPTLDPGATSTGQPVEAGWYPESEHWSRFWDGEGWTDERRPLGDGAGQASVLPPPGSPGEWRIWRSLHEARVRRDDQALATFWLGVIGVGSLILGLITQAGAFVWVALISGIGALITSRFVRDRARQTDDSTLLYLGRWGQALGWVVVAIFAFFIVIWVIFLGVLLGAVN